MAKYKIELLVISPCHVNGKEREVVSTSLEWFANGSAELMSMKHAATKAKESHGELFPKEKTRLLLTTVEEID